jgi:hypothetical protein
MRPTVFWSKFKNSAGRAEAGTGTRRIRSPCGDSDEVLPNVKVFGAFPLAGGVVAPLDQVLMHAVALVDRYGVLL